MSVIQNPFMLERGSILLPIIINAERLIYKRNIVIILGNIVIDIAEGT